METTKLFLRNELEQLFYELNDISEEDAEELLGEIVYDETHDNDLADKLARETIEEFYEELQAEYKENCRLAVEDATETEWEYRRAQGLW